MGCQRILGKDSSGYKEIYVCTCLVDFLFAICARVLSLNLSRIVNIVVRKSDLANFTKCVFANY